MKNENQNHLAYEPAVSWLNCRVNTEKGKWKYSKGIFKTCNRTGNSKVAILSMLNIAERLLYLYFWVNFNKFEDNFR